MPWACALCNRDREDDGAPWGELDGERLCVGCAYVFGLLLHHVDEHNPRGCSGDNRTGLHVAVDCEIVDGKRVDTVWRITGGVAALVIGWHYYAARGRVIGGLWESGEFLEIVEGFDVNLGPFASRAAAEAERARADELGEALALVMWLRRESAGAVWCPRCSTALRNRLCRCESQQEARAAFAYDTDDLVAMARAIVGPQRTLDALALLNRSQVAPSP